jgi:hypothetical protein
MVLREAPSAGLNPPGVRLRNKSNGTAKVQLSIPAGDELEVSETVAAQLGAEFVHAGGDAVAPPVPLVAEEAGGASARTRSGRRSG